MTIIKDIKNSFKISNNFNIIIYINLIVFVFVNLLTVFFKIFNVDEINFMNYISLPADFHLLLKQPWALITYMFTQFYFLHLLFNILIFYWFGKIFLQYLSQNQLLGIYILGGIFGALFYLLSFNIVPALLLHVGTSFVIGASASIMAVVVAIAALVPNHRIYMLFFGEVKIVYIAVAIIFIDIISLFDYNIGGHISHLGGASLGYLFVLRYRKEKDITIGVTKTITFIKSFFITDKPLKQETDKILDKISKSGYSSLTKSEKLTLFKNSKTN